MFSKSLRLLKLPINSDEDAYSRLFSEIRGHSAKAEFAAKLFEFSDRLGDVDESDVRVLFTTMASDSAEMFLAATVEAASP